MKRAILYTVIISIAMSCKSRAIRTQTIEKVCEGSFSLDSGFDVLFNFEKNGDRYYSRSFLIDTLFRDFSISEGTDYIDKAEKYQNHFLEFKKGYNSDVDQSFKSFRQNSFKFYKTNEDKYTLQSAEINFNSDLIFPKEVSEQYKVYASDIGLIDIKNTKAAVQKAFHLKAENICDTLIISTDLESLWIYFKNGKIDKIIPQIYIHR